MGLPSRLEMTMDPVWDLIPLTRNYLQSLLKFYLNDDKRLDEIIIIFSELLENAVKYSRHDPIKIVILNLARPAKLEITITNSALKKHVVALSRIVKELRAANMHGLYIQKLKEMKHYKSHPTGLMGLARIRYETGANLSVRSGKNNVRVCAAFY